MGTYYKMACDELRESIDPGHIDDLGVKEDAVAHPSHPFGSVVIFALLDRWRTRAVRLVNDYADDDAYRNYEDVTNAVLEDYNSRYGTSYMYTGEQCQASDS